jgi:hypothetical protein
MKQGPMIHQDWQTATGTEWDCLVAKNQWPISLVPYSSSNQWSTYRGCDAYLGLQYFCSFFVLVGIEMVWTQLVRVAYAQKIVKRSLSFYEVDELVMSG